MITCSGSSWSKYFANNQFLLRLSVPGCDFTPPVGFLDQTQVIWISCNPGSSRTGSSGVWPYLLVFPERLMHCRFATAGLVIYLTDFEAHLEIWNHLGPLLSDYSHTSTHDEHTCGDWFSIVLHLIISNSSNHPMVKQGNQCLATFTPLKSKILIFFRDVISLLARVFILLIDAATQEVPMKYIWKKLSVQFLRCTIELLHVKRRTRHKWR